MNTHRSSSALAEAPQNGVAGAPGATGENTSTREGSGAKRIFLIAGAQISFLIGAGIATGQEAMQYFAAHGFWGIATIPLVILIFGWVLSSLTEWGRRHTAEEVKDPFVTICGRRFGAFFKILVLVSLFSIAVTMIAGSGAMFENMYDLPVWAGVAALTAFLAVTLMLGFRQLVEIIGRVGPMLIVFLGVICTWIIIENFGELGNVAAWLEVHPTPKAMENPVISAVFYSIAMLLIAVPFLTNLGKTVDGQGSPVRAGTAASVAFGAVILVSTLAILLTLPLIHDASTPLVVLGTQAAPWLGTAFTIVTFLGMFSTAAPMLWSVADQIGTRSRLIYRVSALALCVAAMFGALLVPFGQLVGLIYPLVGVFGVAFFLYFGVQQVRTRRRLAAAR